MNNTRKYERWICLFLSFLTGLALCIVNDNYIIPEELRLQLGGTVAVMLWQVNSAMSQPGYVMCMLIVLLYFAYRYLWNKLDKKFFKWSIPFSVIAAFVLLLCESYYQYNSWDKVFGGQMAFAMSVVRGIGIAVPIFFLFQIICNMQLKADTNQQKIQYNWKRWLVQALLLFICWLPYMIVMFPGNFCPDASDEIAQIMGNREYCWTIKTIVSENDQMIWNNHHPVFYTWILSVFVKLGGWIDSYTWGFAIYTIIQCCCMALALSYFLCDIGKVGVSDKIRKGLLVFFALNPIFSLWSVTITKDIYFSIMLLISVLQIYHFVKAPEEFAFRKKVILSLCLLCLMLLRNNGFYMVLVILPFVIIFFRKKKKQMVAVVVTLVIPMLIFQVGIQGVLFSVLQIPGGSPREMLSVPFQQTARYISEYGDSADEDEIKSIETILGRYQDTVEEIAEDYVPSHADSVKNKYAPDTDGEDLKQYIKAWVKGFTKHPDAYVEAFFNLHYAWFIFDSNQDFHYYYEFISENSKTNLLKMEEKIENMLGEIGRIEGFDNICEGIAYMVNILAKIPVVSWVIEFSSYTWLYIVCGLVMVMRKKYVELLACGMLFANYVICFVGPVAYTRYAIPMMVCAPLILVLTFIETSGKIISE